MNQTAPALHLLRLSATRRALVYDDVGAPQLHTLPLLQVLGVRSGPSADAIDLLHLHTSSPSTSARPARASRQRQAAHEEEQHRRMTIVVGSGTDRDSLLAGLRVMLSKVREPYTHGARVVAWLLRRRALRQWKRRVAQQRWWEEGGGAGRAEEAVLLGIDDEELEEEVGVGHRYKSGRSNGRHRPPSSP